MMKASPMISSAELALLLLKNNVKILDSSTRLGRQAGDCPAMNFRRCRVKGAHYLDLDGLCDQKTNLPFMLPSRDHFVFNMKRLDIKVSDKVVCYDTSPRNVYGFRAAWMFHAMGHKDVSVLDGGLLKWICEEKPVDEDEIEESDFNYKLVPERVVSHD